MTDLTLIREILLCGTNDGDLYARQTQPILKNLSRRLANHTYVPARALDLWQYLADEMVRRYSVEHMGRAKATLTILAKADREILAADLAEHYAEELGA